MTAKHPNEKTVRLTAKEREAIREAVDRELAAGLAPQEHRREWEPVFRSVLRKVGS